MRRWGSRGKTKFLQFICSVVSLTHDSKHQSKNTNDTRKENGTERTATNNIQTRGDDVMDGNHQNARWQKSGRSNVPCTQTHHQTFVCFFPSRAFCSALPGVRRGEKWWLCFSSSCLSKQADRWQGWWARFQRGTQSHPAVLRLFLRLSQTRRANLKLQTFCSWSHHTEPRNGFFSWLLIIKRHLLI